MYQPKEDWQKCFLSIIKYWRKVYKKVDMSDHSNPFSKKPDKLKPINYKPSEKTFIAGAEWAKKNNYK